MKRYYACDVETLDGLRGCEFAVGCIHSGGNTKTFFNEEEFCEFILQKAYPDNRFYFHNLSFDIRFLLDYCRKKKIPIPPPTSSGSSIITQTFHSIKNPQDLVKVFDSYKLLPMPLEKFTEVFGLHVSKPKVDFGNATLQELSVRCHADAQILYDGLAKFFELFPSAKKCVTLPQASMLEFSRSEHRYMFTAKFNPKTKTTDINTVLEDVARLGYFGGRNEVYDFNKYDKVYNYDINSLYPSVMRDNLFPISITINNNKSVLEEELYYVYAEVSMPYYYIPPLAVKHNGKLLFGYGTFEGWFYSPEFRLIKEIADKINIVKGFSFGGDYIFRNFVNKYWSLRKKYKMENNSIETIYKLYLNSLYGKFAQRRESVNYQYEFEIDEGLEELSDGVFLRQVPCFNRSVRINPFISGFITSYARAKLWENLDKYSDIVKYTDTDSMFTTEPINNVGDELGQFKLEGVGEFKPLCCKTYFFKTDNGGYRHKAKGVFRENIPKADTWQELEKAIRKTRIEIYAKPKESIRRFGKFLAVKSMEKELTLDYDKRIIKEDLTTEPICL